MITRRCLGAIVMMLAAALGGCGSGDGPPAATSSQKSAIASAESASESTASEASEASGAVRYLAIGDSLTQGVGAPDEATGSFPALLAQRWRDGGCDVELLNTGVSGSTVEQIIAEQLPQLEPFQPTIVTFQSGGNDLVMSVPVEDYRNNVRTVLDAATGSGARVVVFAQNEWFRAPGCQGYATAEQRDEFDSVLIEEASAKGAEFVDLRPLYKQEADDGQWVEDGIHPTPEAYDAWATEMAEVIGSPCK